MATIYLTLSAKSDTNPQKEIRMRFKHGKIDQQARTNIFIPAEHWNGEAQKITVPNIRLRTSEKKELYNYLTAQSEKLNTLKAKVHTLFNESDRSTITPDWLKILIDRFNFPEKYAPIIETPEVITLFQYIEIFIKDAPNRIVKNTGRSVSDDVVKQYRMTQRKLKEHAESIGKTDFEFSEMNQSFYNAFIAFMQAVPYAQNYIGKHVRVLKTFLNAATTQGYNTDLKYKDFRVHIEDIDNVYLNETELQQIKDTDLSQKPHLDRVRDWFLLLAWTASRFSDLEKITKANIEDGYFNFRQKKTATKVKIPVYSVVREIFEKYGYILPKPISNQRFNEHIKEVCKIAGINSNATMDKTVGGKIVTEDFEKWEHVSSHTGRRSFCTNMFLREVYTTQTIMAISGHKTEKSFMKYIKVTQHQHAEIMKKGWEKSI